ncbi:hypothetical protein BSKO_03587 [Bryopsis sp. KO-2023]|nr:hypothetical protein BSKO_03587 [Bryopsis sp. KO-2023]
MFGPGTLPSGHQCRPCAARRPPSGSWIIPRERISASNSPSSERCRTLPHSGAKFESRVHASKLEATDPSEFTPFTLMQYSKSPDRICHCEAKIVVNAPVERCFDLWNEWRSLLDFLDLIGELHLGDMPENTAVLLCYYRWGNTPTLEIMMKMVKEEVVANKHIKFGSIEGMPMKGIVEFAEVEGGTEVFFRFENCLPRQYVEFNIGHIAVITNVNDILKENMEQFKLLAEGKAQPQENNAFTDEQREAVLKMCQMVMDKPSPAAKKTTSEAAKGEV